MIHSQVNPQIWNHGYGETMDTEESWIRRDDCKLYVDFFFFLLHRGLMSLNPEVQGTTVIYCV